MPALNSVSVKALAGALDAPWAGVSPGCGASRATADSSSYRGMPTVWLPMPDEKEEALLLDVDADPRACHTARGYPHILDENSHSGCSPVSARPRPSLSRGSAYVHSSHPHGRRLRALSFGRSWKQKRGRGKARDSQGSMCRAGLQTQTVRLQWVFTTSVPK